MLSAEELKYKKYYRVVGTTLLLGLVVYSFILARKNGDFQVFLEAAGLLKSGTNPYGVWLLDANCLYYYSPLWAALLMPIYEYSYIVKLCWLLFNVGLLYRLWSFFNSYMEGLKLTAKENFWLLLLILLVSHRFILYNFMMVQMTIFILWVSFESLRSFDKQKLVRGALLLAFAINVKLLAIVLIPYLVYRKQFLAAGLTVFFFMVYLVAPALYFGWDYNMELHESWWKMINPNSKEHKFDAELGPHSLTALIPSLLMETKGHFDRPRHLVNLSIDHVLLIVNSIRAMLILLFIYFLRMPLFVKAKSKVFQFWELSYLLLLIPLIFPHQQKYAFLLALPAQFYILVWMMRWNGNAKRKIIFYGVFITSFLLMTMTSDAFIGRHFNLLTQYYKLITYGALLLVPLLFFANPSRIAAKRESE